MQLKELISQLTPEIRENLCTAIEIGRWPDGTKLTDDQKASSIQAVIAWDALNGETTDEPFRVQKGGKFIHLADKATSTTTKIIINSKKFDQ